MFSTDRLLLFLHIGFAIFALGPLTAATMATPRYIRRRDARIVRYLNRATRLYGLLTLGILLFGLLLAHGRFNQAWLSASMTLYVVAIALLVLVEHDQRRAIHAIELAAAEQRPAVAEAAPAEPEAETPAETPAATPAAAAEVAKVETGRIGMISGVVALIWVVSLVLMIWNA